jgi:hypothetical protein
MRNLISEMINLIQNNLVLCDVNGNIRLYNINEKVCVFMVPNLLLDSSGWKDIDGFAFKEKLYILNLSTTVLWRRTTFYERLWISTRYRTLNPMNLIVKVNRGKLKKYIKQGSVLNPIYLYLDIKL